MQPNYIQINECPFWIRLYNLPFNCQSERAVRAVAGRVGRVMEVEVSKVCWDRSRKVRVLIDVRKPLKESVKAIDTTGKECLILIKYERLPFFCFVCGMLDHTEKDCNNVAEEELGERRRWGSWIRASPRRGRGRLVEEVESFEAMKGAISDSVRMELQFGGSSSRERDGGRDQPVSLTGLGVRESSRDTEEQGVSVVEGVIGSFISTTGEASTDNPGGSSGEEGERTGEGEKVVKRGEVKLDVGKVGGRRGGRKVHRMNRGSERVSGGEGVEMGKRKDMRMDVDDAGTGLESSKRARVEISGAEGGGTTTIYPIVLSAEAAKEQPCREQ